MHWPQRLFAGSWSSVRTSGTFHDVLKVLPVVGHPEGSRSPVPSANAVTEAFADFHAFAESTICMAFRYTTALCGLRVKVTVPPLVTPLTSLTPPAMAPKEQAVHLAAITELVPLLKKSGGTSAGVGDDAGQGR